MGKADQKRWEKKLFRFAAIDNANCTQGLGTHAHLVDDWATDPDLRHVRKLDCGRHRCYITGKNTDCKYFLCYILVNKRVETDQPQTGKFKRMIMNALADDQVRRVLPPPPNDEENEEKDQGMTAA